MLTIRTSLLGVAILACWPMIASAQTTTKTTESASCCGQDASFDLSIEETARKVQANIQSILKQKHGAKRLTKGDFLVSENSGFELRAMVSRRGTVDAWYLNDSEGATLALMQSNGGLVGIEKSIEGCISEFSRNLAACDAIPDGYPNRLQLCLNHAWRSFFNCLATSDIFRQ